MKYINYNQIRFQKIKLFLILGLLYTLEANGQVYFQNNTKYFDEHARHPEIPPGTWSASIVLLDSIKEDKRFYSVWEKGYIFNKQRGPYKKSFLMIQDTYKVYQRNLNDTILRLMYDFSKGKGDTIKFEYSYTPKSIAVIDSVAYKMIGGVLRKIQYIPVKVYNIVKPYQLIEGIGCIGIPTLNPGLITRFEWGLSETIWSCMNICIDNNRVYGSMNCYWDTAVNIKHIKKEISKIYPNPNEGNFIVEIENPEKNVSIEVYDLLGKLLKTIETNSSQHTYTIELDVSEGIYLLKVINGDMVFFKRVRIINE